MKNSCRLFFAYSIDAPWPSSYPEGRLIAEEGRHITVAFLGNCDPNALLQNLHMTPLPHLSISPVGIADRILFLPKDAHRVASYHVDWLEKKSLLEDYANTLGQWLKALGYSVDARPWLSHVTIARAPFKTEEWESSFEPLPCAMRALTLYESMGNLTYKPLWSHSWLLPFEEFEHTADIAFRIRGSSLKELFLHAQYALAFKFPPLLSFVQEGNPSNIDEIIINLNELVMRADCAIGCPFKSVSFHGEIRQDKHNILIWEMIVDV